MVYNTDYLTNLTSILVVALLQCQSCEGQKTSILDRPEVFQRKFVADYLEEGHPKGDLDGYPKTSDHHNDFMVLTMFTEWALPLAEIRLKEWMLQPALNKDKIDNLVEAISYTGTIRSFDLIVRVFAQRPELDKWVDRSLHSKFGSPNPNFISKWYHALQYPDSHIRELAREIIPTMVRQPPTENTYYVWSEALIDRHNQEPTTANIMQDPIVQLLTLTNLENPETMRQKLSNASKEGYSRRQAVGQKQGK